MTRQEARNTLMLLAALGPRRCQIGSLPASLRAGVQSLHAAFDSIGKQEQEQLMTAAGRIAHPDSFSAREKGVL